MNKRSNRNLINCFYISLRATFHKNGDQNRTKTEKAVFKSGFQHFSLHLFIDVRVLKNGRLLLPKKMLRRLIKEGRPATPHPHSPAPGYHRHPHPTPAHKKATTLYPQTLAPSISFRGLPAMSALSPWAEANHANTRLRQIARSVTSLGR